ncbi:MAG: SDR family oxidoreductase [Deltaproteobacteria bacterium]|nr:MAG: SDR family oxidoreductase [Deltaproteobacteria bacterium]
MGSLEGKVALVTGGASGIGRTIALTLAREGARVVIGDIDSSGGEETAHLVTDSGGEAVFLKADVCMGNQVKAMIDKAMGTYRRLDCACNNAGIAGVPANTAECTEENWDRTVLTNLKGVWLCMKYEIPQMLKQGGGAIVNTSSVAGLVGLRGWSAYVASKHGVLGLTKSAALEYARAGVRINAVCPSIINTPMAECFTGGDPRVEAHILAQEPMGRMGSAEEVAEAVVWLCSDASSFVTGHALTVDGGLLAR